MDSPSRPPARRVLVLESSLPVEPEGHPACLGSPCPHPPGRKGPDTLINHTLLSASALAVAPQPLPEPVPSLVLSSGMPQPRFCRTPPCLWPSSCQECALTTWLPNEYLLGPQTGRQVSPGF